MTNRQKVASCIIISLILLSLTSCTSQNTLCVNVPFVGERTVHAQKFDLEELKARANTDTVSNHYYAVTIENQNVAVSYFDASDTCRLDLNNGYFLGMAMHMDGWVRHFPYFSTMPEAGESTLVLNEGATACLKYDNNTGLIFTDKSGGLVMHENGIPQENYGAVYVANSNGTVELLVETPWPASACVMGEDGDTVWFVAGHQIYRIDEDKEVTEVLNDVCLYYLGSCSLNELNGQLYIGALGGFAVYDTQTNDLTWFPLE